MDWGFATIGFLLPQRSRPILESVLKRRRTHNKRKEMILFKGEEESCKIPEKVEGM